MLTQPESGKEIADKLTEAAEHVLSVFEEIEELKG